MLENKNKREGQLLGRLNKERHRAPTGVIRDNAWVKDGDFIRALGAPMGNNLDVTEWYISRYRTVKERISLWPSIRRLALTGRNMLLQSIFYGSFRYWLYFLVMPNQVADAIELDAKQILWATNPQLLANETGTSRASRRYIHRKASYLPVKKGGGGIMHWRAHCEAFYAEWIIRYLHPRKAPWKSIAEQWIADTHIGNQILLVKSEESNRSSRVPHTAPYLKKCLNAFARLKIRQNTSLLDHTIQAEPFWYNWRFPANLPNKRIKVWQNKLEVNHILDLFDADTNDHFTDGEWDAFLRETPLKKTSTSHAVTLPT
jgi:hypothetical protein